MTRSYPPSVQDMAEQRQVTALMPLRAYHPRLLALSVDSMLEQTNPHWALNIIVEKSDIATFRKVLARQLQDPRILLMANSGRKLAGAINSGMAAATTPFVAIILADDQWAPEAVAVLTEAIDQHPGADYFHSSRRYIDENGDSISCIYHGRQNVTLTDFRTGTPVKHLLCWRRSLGLECGGLDESLNSVGPDDFDFPWTMAEQGAVFHAIDECLYLYREHEACFRLTTDLPRSVHEKEIGRVLRKHGLSATEIESWVEQGRESWLRQCRYDSKWQRWLYRLTKRSRPSIRPVYK